MMMKSLSALCVTAAAAWAAAPVTITGTPSVPAIRGQLLEAARTESPVVWNEASCYSEADEAEVRDFAHAHGVRLSVITPKTRTPYSRLSSLHNPAFARLKIEQWKDTGSFEQLLALPRQAVETDWYTRETKPLQFALAFDGKSLWFLAQRAPLAESKPAAKAKSDDAKAPAPQLMPVEKGFDPAAHEGDHTLLGFSNYQGNIFWEIDLSPTGKWWSCLYDKVHGAAPLPGLKGDVETRTLHTPEGDIALMRLPLASLTAIDPESARGSVGGVFGATRMTTGKDITGESDLLRPSGWPFTSMFVPF